MKRSLFALCLAGLTAVLSAPAGLTEPADTTNVELPPGFSLWQPSLNVRAGLGYKDNLTLSSFAPQGSAFEKVSGEAMLLRLPWNNWQVNLFAVGSDTRYFDHSAGVDAEQTAATSAQFTWFPHDDWRSVTAVEYTYLNQVMDVSATYGSIARQQILGQGLTARQGVRADLGPWFGEANVAGSRYYYHAPLDDYWTFGPTARAGRYYGYASELSVAGSFLPQHYDTREQVGQDGIPLAGTSLRFVSRQIELAWLHYWDEPRRWRVSARASAERNTDNGTGYFDYWQYGLTGQLRWRPPGWGFTAGSGASYYDFDRQRVSLTDARIRRRTVITALLRAEKQLGNHWKVYAAYDYERSLSNARVEAYAAHTGSGGIEYEY